MDTINLVDSEAGSGAADMQLSLRSELTLCVTFGSATVFPRARVLLVNGEGVAVSNCAFEILLMLIDADGQLVSKTGLFQRLWPRICVAENNLRVHMCKLRKALGENARFIKTIPNWGYRLTWPRPIFRDGNTQRRALSHFRQDEFDVGPTGEPAMPCSYDTLTLEDAKRMLCAAETKAASLGIAYNIAVVDAGGHLLAFVRQDRALIGSIDLAIDKAVTARLFDRSTSDLAKLSQSGEPLFGINRSNAGKVAIFGGGIPINLGGAVVGAVGTSAGTVEQDIAVAEAAVAAFNSTSKASANGDARRNGRKD